MDFQDYVKFANENPVCYLATVDGDQPRVRPVAMWFADKTGFYFQAQSVKAVSKQLQKNNKVEIAFYDPKAEPGLGKVMRVSGKVEFLEDMALKTKCLEDRPFLKQYGVKGPDDPMLSIFRVYTGEAFFWTGANSTREAEIERVKF